MKKILIAGGTGFIGYHLAKYAIKKRYKVFSISKNPPSKKRKIKEVTYLYCDLSKRTKRIKNNRFDYVVNCSGYGKHYKSNYLGKKLYNEHVNSLINLIKIIDKKRIKKFVQIGTSLEYSESKTKISENHKCNPVSIYGQAKLACTNYLRFLNEKFNFPVTIFRVFQVYGPTQNIDRLIPFVINSCKKDIKFSVTSGNQIRNFCYILDLIDAIFKSLSNKKSNGEILNIGSSKSITVKKLINLIREKIGKGNPAFGKKSKHIGEFLRIEPNIDKIKKILKWKPIYNLKDGLLKTIVD